MCNEFCKHLKRWCRSFTGIERVLTVIETILLVGFLVFLVLIVMHLIFCPGQQRGGNGDGHSTEPVDASTLPSGGKTCSWKPSEKTTVTKQYYFKFPQNVKDMSERRVFEHFLSYSRESDGEEGDADEKKYMLALVKIVPGKDVTFGCTLTVISEYWSITAASCVEAIEEVDSLDSFVMLHNYGEPRLGSTHDVVDVQIHPSYKGSNKSYDVVALKAEDSLTASGAKAVQLASPLDYHMLTIGESFYLYGFGKYRVQDEKRTLHRALSWLLPPSECGPGVEEEEPSWAARHLWRSSAPFGSCAERSLCAGALSSRGRPCHYCAGTPLMRRHRLYALMAHAPHCALSCEPSRFLNLPHVAHWLASLMAETSHTND